MRDDSVKQNPPPHYTTSIHHCAEQGGGKGKTKAQPLSWMREGMEFFSDHSTEEVREQVRVLTFPSRLSLGPSPH